MTHRFKVLSKKDLVNIAVNLTAMLGRLRNRYIDLKAHNLSLLRKIKLLERNLKYREEQFSTRQDKQGYSRIKTKGLTCRKSLYSKNLKRKIARNNK